MLTVSKLSKQQKAILESLYKEGKRYITKRDKNTQELFIDKENPIYTRNITRLSWFIAKKFNKNSDRIYNPRQEFLQEVSEAAKEGMTDQKFALLNLKKIFLMGHRKRKLLTCSHRASFSRTLTRLEKRGLLERVGDVGIRLTEKGKAIAQELMA